MTTTPPPGSEGAAPSPGLFDRLMRRPVSALMLFILVCVLGVVAYQRIPVLLMPQGISDPSMSIRVPYPGSSPEEVLEKVTKPIEDAARTLANVIGVSSRSGADESRVTVEFTSNTDMDEAYNLLQDQLERVKPTLPDGVGRVSVFRFNFDAEMPIVWFGILCDSSVADPYGLVEDLIQPRLESVDGVAQVSVWGMVQESVRVFVKPEKLRSHGLSLYEVVGALRRDNFTLPAGTIDDGGREFLLRIDNSYRSLDEVRAYPIAENLQLSDVADVEVARSYRDYVNRVNGKNALTASISKESDSNTVETCQRVLAMLDTLKADSRLQGISFNMYFTQSDLIVGALGNLKSSMGWGALFAVLILYLFVRRITLTLLVALAIPVSLLTALVAVYFTGHTFNIISMAGFTLAIGMLVDNSVVVAENISRLREQGLSPLRAAAAGAGQVSLAIVLATLTTVVVFTPMVFMANDRNTRVLLGELATPITFSLLASLFTALVFLPIATVYLGGSLRTSPAPGGAARPPGRILRAYRGVLAFTLDHRFGVSLATVVVTQLGMTASKHLEYNFGGNDGGDNRLRVEVEVPKRFTIEEARDVFGEIERYLLAHREEYQVRDVGADFRRTGGRVNMWFEKGVTDKHRKDLGKRLRTELPHIAGVRYKVGVEGDDGKSSVRVNLYGRDSRVLKRLGDEVVRDLEQVKELTNVHTDIEEGLDELRVSIDRDRAQRFGVSQEVLQGIIQWGVGGQTLADYRGGSREMPMLLEYEDPADGDLSYLRSLDVPVGARGGSVPLSTMMQLEFAQSVGDIRRVDGVTSLGIQAESFDPNSYRIQRTVAERLDRYPFPEGYGWTDDSGQRKFEEGMNEVFRGLLVGTIFVFLLMGMLFESAILPLSVLLSIPLALVGAYMALFISHTPMDGTASLALILLAGVVVNNGIVLIDRIAQLRGEGFARREAILTGCAQRVRPVLMTAITTMFGLLPMALPQLFAANQDSGLNYQSLAVATLGGLTLSTLLTLLVLPLFYTLCDDLGLFLRATIGLRPPPLAPFTTDAASPDAARPSA